MFLVIAPSKTSENLFEKLEKIDQQNLKFICKKSEKNLNLFEKIKKNKNIFQKT